MRSVVMGEAQEPKGAVSAMTGHHTRVGSRLHRRELRTLTAVTVRKAGPVKANGIEVPIVWNGRRARAFVPARLAKRDLSLSPTTVTRVARAQAAVEHGAES